MQNNGSPDSSLTVRIFPNAGFLKIWIFAAILILLKGCKVRGHQNKSRHPNFPLFKSPVLIKMPAANIVLVMFLRDQIYFFPLCYPNDPSLFLFKISSDLSAIFLNLGLNLYSILYFDKWCKMVVRSRSRYKIVSLGDNPSV